MDLIFKIICVAFILVLLYFLAIMPKMYKRKNKPSVILFAHRGLHDNYSKAPENSLKAFRKAVLKGYGIELDIQLSKDKVPVVFHDYSLKRVCGIDKKVKDLTCNELQVLKLCDSAESIPTLKEVLELVDGRVPLIIEHKIEVADLSICRIVAPMLLDYKGAYVIESFNPFCLAWYRKHHKNIIRGQLSTNLIKESATKSRVLSFLLQNLLFNFVTKPDFIAFDHKYKNMLSFSICRKLYKITTYAWTIISEEELKENRMSFDAFIFEGFSPMNESF